MSTASQADILSSTVLYCTKGSSNKEYHLALEKNTDGYLVRYANGKRGSTLTRGLKTASPTSLEIAQKVYDKTLREKLRDDYYPAGETVNADVQSIIASKPEKIDFDPQLLIPIDEAQAEELCKTMEYGIQLKYDGERRFASYNNGAALFGNRKGEKVQVRQHLADALIEFAEKCGGESFAWDCEDMGETLVIFDLLKYKGEDLRESKASFHLRAMLMTTLQHEIEFYGFEKFFKVEYVQDGLLFEQVKAIAEFDSEEGLVLKHWDSVIEPGLSHNAHFKLKFWKDATVKVLSVHPTKRSVQMGVLDGTNWVAVGNVTIPVNASIPAPETLIDVKYLYAYPNGGSLFEPSFKRVRTDLTELDCSIEKLSYKKGSDQVL